MLIETSEAVYETFFQHAQLEITGTCNMDCLHCRASTEARVHMGLDLARSILLFATANAETNFRLTISGGEPFKHPGIVEVLAMAKALGINDIIVTTNGSLVTDEIIGDLKRVSVKNLCIQVSVDSINAEKHDAFRRHKGAFSKATSCLKRVSQAGILTSLRATVNPENMGEIGGLISLARDCGAIRVGIGSVIPAGMGKQNRDLLLSPAQKKFFIEELSRQKQINADIDVTTEDPLKFAMPDCAWDYGGGDITSPAFFGGCTAGITGFNADSEGTLTPCAVLLKPIVNVREKSLEEILKAYVGSSVIQSLVERKYSGKCGLCPFKRLCGGCRAVADGLTGDYLSSDLTCWLQPKV